MARYIVDSQIDNHEKYYFIREQESQDIVLLPSKYLMHKKRSKLSPNTIRRSAGAISYYEVPGRDYGFSESDADMCAVACPGTCGIGENGGSETVSSDGIGFGGVIGDELL